MKRLVADDAKSAAIKAAIMDRNISKAPLSEKEKLAMVYAQALTSTPPKATEAMVADLRGAGYNDGEILEINQVLVVQQMATSLVFHLMIQTTQMIGHIPNSYLPTTFKDFATANACS